MHHLGLNLLRAAAPVFVEVLAARSQNIQPRDHEDATTERSHRITRLQAGSANRKVYLLDPPSTAESS